MMKNPFVFLLFLIFIVPACEGILEPDLDDEVIVLLSPPDHHSTDLQAVTFWWEEVTGTEVYNLQIVVPNFTSTTQLVLDTNITDNQFTISLQPNSYQWRVRAENTTSESPYTIRNLTIEENNDLSNQQVVLNSPTDQLITNVENQTFEWQALNELKTIDFK